MAEVLVHTAAGGAPPRSRGGRPLSAVLPGLPQLLVGRWGSGGTAFLSWVGLLWITVTRFGPVTQAVRGDWDDQLAVGTVVLGLAASWLWSWRDVSALGEPKRVGVSQWDLAVRAFSRNRTAVAGLIVIGKLLGSQADTRVQFDVLGMFGQSTDQHDRVRVMVQHERHDRHIGVAG